MFVSSGQFIVFIACVSIGAISGIFLSGCSLIYKFCKNKLLLQFFYGFSLVFTTIIFIVMQYKLNFPSFRIYMLFGVFIGLIIYVKSFNLVLAKVAEKLYNIIRKIIVPCRIKKTGKHGRGNK